MTKATRKEVIGLRAAISRRRKQRAWQRLAVPQLSQQELIEELEGEITVYRDSYQEADGIVRDAEVLRTMQALGQAIAIVKRHNEPSGGGE